MKFICQKSSLDKLDGMFLDHPDVAARVISFENYSNMQPIELVMFALLYREKQPQLISRIIQYFEMKLQADSQEDERFKQYFDTVLSHQVDANNVQQQAIVMGYDTKPEPRQPSSYPNFAAKIV